MMMMVMMLLLSPPSRFFLLACALFIDIYISTTIDSDGLVRQRDVETIEKCFQICASSVWDSRGKRAYELLKLGNGISGKEDLMSAVEAVMTMTMMTVAVAALMGIAVNIMVITVIKQV